MISRLSSRPKSVLFFPTESAAQKWGATTPNPIIALESVVSLGPDGLIFDTAAIEATLTDSKLARPTTLKKKPVPKRATRETGIAKLVKEIKEHLREARDHAYATLALQGEAKLLERPTQKHLAERTGMTEPDVSRCLNDESALVLKMCWEAALDLHQVMGFSESAW